MYKFVFKFKIDNGTEYTIRANNYNQAILELQSSFLNQIDTVNVKRLIN